MWEKHMKCEFATKSVEDTMATMIEPAHVNHVPVNHVPTMTGGVGMPAIADFDGKHFIPKRPPDTKTELVSRTVGEDRIVDELIFSFTQTVPMDWMLPGVPPTGRAVRVPLAAIIGFKGGKVQNEHIYWDQASLLVQIGLLDALKFPVAGAQTADKVTNPKLPSNALIER